MNHTKAPWQVIGSPEKGYGISSDEEMVVYRGMGGILNVADAMLIAAAPDLLSVCRVAAHTFREYEQIHLAKPDLMKAGRNAKMAEFIEAVIDKAEGK